jgi:hypothetical protein
MPLARTRLLNVAKYALKFDGVDDYVEIPYTTVLTELTTIAYAAPFAIPSIDFAFTSYFSRGVFGAGGWAHGVRALRTGIWQAYFYDVTVRTVNGPPIQLNTFVFLAATAKNNDFVKFYVNQEFIGQTAIGTLWSSYDRIIIGGKAIGYINWFNGYISQILIYSRALTPAEIQWNYNFPENPVRNGLILWLSAHPNNIKDIDGDGILEWLDLSGFNNHGKIRGPVLQEVILPAKRILSPTRIQAPVR